MMRALLWLATCFVLVVLIVGVGLVMAFVFDATSVVGAAVGASLAVAAWHALRRIEPRPGAARPEDGWPVAIGGLVGFVAVWLAALWNPWLLVFGWIVFPLWARVARRRE